MLFTAFSFLPRKKHNTGKEYRVIGLAKHSETLEDLVVYEALYNNETSRLWVRPAKMFLGQIEINHATVPRFTYLGE